jgi:UPF0271 protein
LAGSPMLEVFREAGLAVAAEGFADRRYEADGSLRSRKFADGLISDPAEAAQQSVLIVESGIVRAWNGQEVQIKAQTICIHGDTPGAPDVAISVVQALRLAGVDIGVS